MTPSKPPASAPARARVEITRSASNGRLVLHIVEATSTRRFRQALPPEMGPWQAREFAIHVADLLQIDRPWKGLTEQAIEHRLNGLLPPRVPSKGTQP